MIPFMIFGAGSGYIFYKYIHLVIQKEEKIDFKDDPMKPVFDLLYFWKKNLRPRLYSFIGALVLYALAAFLNGFLSLNNGPTVLFYIKEIFFDVVTNVARLLLLMPMLLSKYKPMAYVLRLKGFGLLS
mmetsp:Transcript_42318/g.64907  ORF Transcript_42318/g.64907 Transcript_42318/m.64907 type:complete len:128 (-) Transcript_42318:305-688(-)